MANVLTLHLALTLLEMSTQSIEKQCRDVVERFKAKEPDWFNDDQHYGKAVADVLDLRSQAECMLDLWLIGGVSHAQTARTLQLKVTIRGLCDCACLNGCHFLHKELRCSLMWLMLATGRREKMAIEDA